MKHKPIKSSMIVSAGHENGVLEVEFKNGKRYQYKDVPVELFDKLMSAKSAEKFFGQNILGKFGYESKKDEGR